MKAAGGGNGPGRGLLSSQNLAQGLRERRQLPAHQPNLRLCGGKDVGDAAVPGPVGGACAEAPPH